MVGPCLHINALGPVERGRGRAFIYLFPAATSSLFSSYNQPTSPPISHQHTSRLIRFEILLDTFHQSFHRALFFQSHSPLRPQPQHQHFGLPKPQPNPNLRSLFAHLPASADLLSCASRAIPSIHPSLLCLSPLPSVLRTPVLPRCIFLCQIHTPSIPTS